MTVEMIEFEYELNESWRLDHQDRVVDLNAFTAAYRPVIE
jgi:hypothetical protein